MDDLAILSAHPVFDELFDEIVMSTATATGAGTAATTETLSVRPTAGSASVSSPRRRRRRGSVLVLAGVSLVVGAIAIALAFFGGVTNHTTTTTAYNAGRPFPSGPRGVRPSILSGRWLLLSAQSAAAGTWEQNTDGPPPGTLTCANTDSCYVMAGTYASPSANAPLLSESFYATTDFGVHWLALPMPAGFHPSTALSCPSASVCAAGGTIGGQSVLVSTVDGGHQWATIPTAGVSGELLHLACSSAIRCTGIAGSISAGPGLNLNPSGVADQTFVTTTDGGEHWSTSALPVAGAVLQFACSGDGHCVVLGSTGPDIFKGPSFVMTTSDDGLSWTNGSLPAGFAITYIGGLSCAGDQHCLVEGFLYGGSVSGIASTSDGGHSWALEQLPSNVPRPQLSAIACATATTCWASGSESVPIDVGNVHDEGSSMLLGTSDGGATWSKVTFTVPTGAPNAYGQSYLSMGSIDCPSAHACIALGEAAQSSPTAPIYSFVSASGAPAT